MSILVVVRVDAVVLAAQVKCPVGFEVPVADDGAEPEEGLGALETPAGAGDVEAVADQMPGRAFHYSGGHRPAGGECLVAAQVLLAAGPLVVLTMAGLRRRVEILDVARKRRARRITVLGSVARGEAHPDSDLDLLVDFEPRASLLDHIGLFQDLEDLLGVGVDVVARSALKTRDEAIRAEAVDL